MTPAARISAAIEVLDAWLGGTPLEPAFLAWSRRSRFAGSKDRAAIRDLIFDAARRRRSLAALGGAETGRGLMLGALRAEGTAPEDIFTGEGYAPAPLSEAERGAGGEPGPGEALDLPDWLLPEWRRSLGATAEEVALRLRERAPVHLRVNLSVADRAAAAQALAGEGITVREHPEVRTALEVIEGARQLRNSAALAKGLVELQDAASQAVVLRCLPEGADRILDYCAGGGGKALALADLSGLRVVAHDIAPRRMADLPERAARAALQIERAEPGALQDKEPFDLVLCDAPCSGSGAWRRDPEGKWRLTGERLAELGRAQDEVLDAAIGHVAPGGRLAYATCSVLASENEERVAAFLARHPDWQETDRMRTEPGAGGDGFFLAILERRAKNGSA